MTEHNQPTLHRSLYSESIYRHLPAVDTLQNAMSALRARIAVMADYVDAVESGKESANLEILRSIESVGSRLPIMTNDKFNEHFCGEIRRQTL